MSEVIRRILFVLGIIVACAAAVVYVVEVNSRPHELDVVPNGPDLFESQDDSFYAKRDHEKWCPAIPAVADSNLKETIKKLRRESGVE